MSAELDNFHDPHSEFEVDNFDAPFADLIEEVDDCDRATPLPISLSEVRARKQSQEFWNDPCWSEES